MIAMTIMAMLVGTLGVLADGVQQSYEYTEGHSLATQHGRVAIERIAASVREATASEQFPGAIVVAEDVGRWRFPDMLVVWRPDGAAADPDGLPRFDELVIYCPDPDTPRNLLEITAEGDTRTVPSVDDSSGWETAIEKIKESDSARRVVLTPLLRSAQVDETSPDSRRAAVRFETRLRPSADEWTDYEEGSLDWDELAWVQGTYGSQTGLRQTWVRMELQLMPGEEAAADPSGQPAIPYFGSAASYYEVNR